MLYAHTQDDAKKNALEMIARVFVPECSQFEGRSSQSRKLIQ
jgi:hypothetical protein